MDDGWNPGRKRKKPGSVGEKSGSQKPGTAGTNRTGEAGNCRDKSDRRSRELPGQIGPEKPK